MKTTACHSIQQSVRPIGVFDSGLGGLTVVGEIRRHLPNESVVYFGDLARLPYGIKSKEQIRRFSVQNTLFLLKHHVKALVIACNSSASAAYTFLKNNFNLPILDVIEPAAAAAVQATRTKRVGVIATQATIDSGTYERTILRRDSGVRVFTKACPLFVSLVEEGWLEGSIPRQIIQNYLDPICKKKVDVLILGCTHYPLLGKLIQKVVGPRVRLIDSAAPTVSQLNALLEAKNLRCFGRGRGTLRIFVSDKPRNFVRLGEKFLAEKLSQVKLIREL